ncbi:MAG: hypothetical protein E2O95_02765 [Acidobacteria bacterium]|nr:MAG: hypothetical protein E2O95_02765 [Acidobacteriota bacterium]
MPDDNVSTERDWVVPAVLVGVVAALAIVVAVGFAYTAQRAADDSVVGQLERWTSCLRSEGVNVPLVESLRDGGIRITIDGSLLEEGFDFESVRPALEACESDAPDAVKRVTSFLDYVPFLPFGR